MSDIANSFHVIERVLDFSIEISKPVRRLRHRGSSRISQNPILSDEEYAKVRSINFDVEEFRYDDRQRTDLFYFFGEVERSLRDGKEPNEQYIRALLQIANNRPVGRSRVYALRYLVVALAELFEDENEFGERTSITFVSNPEDPKYDQTTDLNMLSDEDAEALEPIWESDLFRSPFTDFVEGFANTIGLDLPSKAKLEFWSNARQILVDWKAIRNRRLLKSLKTTSSLEEIASLVTHH